MTCVIRLIGVAAAFYLSAAAGTASQPGSTPKSLADVGEFGENLYDEAKASDWTKAAPKLQELQAAAKQLTADLKGAEALLKQDQEKVHTERKQLEEENKRDLSALDSYLKERKEIEGSVSSDLIFRYDRVRKHRGGIGVAAARNEVCEICQVRIRPQVFQEIRKNNQIIACDACQRILYDPENLDHPFEVA